MPRRRRRVLGGYVYHVLNRAAGRRRIFVTDNDYLAVESVLREAVERSGTRVLTYCVMPNHWHLLMWPREDDELSDFMRWFTHTHTQRYHQAHGTTGEGPIYQGRFKDFPVAEDEHFYALARYVERNALRANLVSKAELWRYGGLWHRHNATGAVPLAAWPCPEFPDWIDFVNAPQTKAELAEIRACLKSCVPYGNEAWRTTTILRLSGKR